MDLQAISSVVAINFKILNDKSAEVFQRIGVNYSDIIITPAIQECVKAVTAKYNAEELISNRQIVGDEMNSLLKQKISSYGFEVQIFNIISFDFSPEFNAAIEAKQIAQQNALKASQDLERIKIEAQQTVTQAQAEADSYKLKSQEITPEILLMNYIDKWDGKLPVMVSGDGSVMLDVTTLMEQIQSGTVTPIVTPVTPVTPVVTPEVTPEVTDVITE
jgi:hypothetical protein